VVLVIVEAAVVVEVRVAVEVNAGVTAVVEVRVMVALPGFTLSDLPVLMKSGVMVMSLEMAA
jgi:hypothetical protein